MDWGLFWLLAATVLAADITKELRRRTARDLFETLIWMWFLTAVFFRRLREE